MNINAFPQVTDDVYQQIATCIKYTKHMKYSQESTTISTGFAPAAFSWQGFSTSALPRRTIRFERQRSGHEGDRGSKFKQLLLLPRQDDHKVKPRLVSRLPHSSWPPKKMYFLCGHLSRWSITVFHILFFQLTETGACNLEVVGQTHS